MYKVTLPLFHLYPMCTLCSNHRTLFQEGRDHRTILTAKKTECPELGARSRRLVAMRALCVQYLQQVILSVSDPPPPPSYGEHSAPPPNNNHPLLPSGQNFGRLTQKRTNKYIFRWTNRRQNFWRTLLEKTKFSFICVSFTCISFNSFQVF
jgi:hypothetical protein